MVQYRSFTIQNTRQHTYLLIVLYDTITMLVNALSYNTILLQPPTTQSPCQHLAMPSSSPRGPPLPISDVRRGSTFDVGLVSRQAEDGRHRHRNRCDLRHIIFGSARWAMGDRRSAMSDGRSAWHDSLRGKLTFDVPDNRENMMGEPSRPRQRRRRRRSRMTARTHNHKPQHNNQPKS